MRNSFRIADASNQGCVSVRRPVPDDAAELARPSSCCACSSASVPGIPQSRRCLCRDFELAHPGAKLEVAKLHATITECWGPLRRSTRSRARPGGLLRIARHAAAHAGYQGRRVCAAGKSRRRARPHHPARRGAHFRSKSPPPSSNGRHCGSVRHGVRGDADERAVYFFCSRTRPTSALRSSVAQQQAATYRPRAPLSPAPSF